MGRKPTLPAIYHPTADTKTYWCRFTVDGVRYRLPTGTRDPDEAAKEAQRLHAEASLGRGPAARRRIRRASSTGPLKLLAAEYIVWTRANGKAESYVVKQEMHFRAHFLDRWHRIDQITTPAIEQYKVDRRAAKAKLPTVYKELVTLSRFLRWAKKHGHLHEIPEFDRFKPVSDYQPIDLTPEDVAALLAEVPDRAAHPKHYPVREFFTVQWAQASRPGEVKKLRWQHVDLRKGRLTVPPTNDKARVGRTVGLAPEALAVLLELAKAPHLQTAPVFGRSDYRRSLTLAGERAGFPDVTPHHLRHARLSELASTTRDVAAVQFLAGHKNLATTDRYVRSRTERTELMFAQMPKKSSRPKRQKRKGAPG